MTEWKMEGKGLTESRSITKQSQSERSVKGGKSNQRKFYH